jgi:hypothetical protein
MLLGPVVGRVCGDASVNATTAKHCGRRAVLSKRVDAGARVKLVHPLFPTPHLLPEVYQALSSHEIRGIVHRIVYKTTMSMLHSNIGTHILKASTPSSSAITTSTLRWTITYIRNNKY